MSEGKKRRKDLKPLLCFTVLCFMKSSTNFGFTLRLVRPAIPVKIQGLERSTNACIVTKAFEFYIDPQWYRNDAVVDLHHAIGVM